MSTSTTALDCRNRVSDMLDSFVEVAIGDALHITVGDAGFECRVHDIDRTDSRYTMLLETFGNDYLRVETQWAGGWLDPQVDRLKPVAEERQPLGELQSIEPA